MIEKIKTFEDACKEIGVDFKAPKGLTPDELAYLHLKIITKALNEGWEPDWHNHDEYKYYPWFYMGGKGKSGGVGFSFGDYDYGLTFSGVGSRLCFKTRELARYAGKQFEELYKDFYLK